MASESGFDIHSNHSKQSINVVRGAPTNQQNNEGDNVSETSSSKVSGIAQQAHPNSNPPGITSHHLA